MEYSNIQAKNIQIFEPKIFEYSYSVHCSITNIFVFVFGPKYDSEYIRIRIHAKKNIPNIFVFVFGPKNNIRYTLGFIFIFEVVFIFEVDLIFEVIFIFEVVLIF